MQVANKSAVSIHYTLTNRAGEKLDSSIGGEPLSYLHGEGNIIAGLEQALLGKKVGDKFTTTVEPALGYGEYRPGMVQTVSRDMFEGIDKIEIGMMFHAEINDGYGVVTVTRIDGDQVTVDGNHPLAGQALTFDVEVIDIRAATAEELAHGHVHGAGCDH